MAPTFRHSKDSILKLIHAGSSMWISSGLDDSQLQRQANSAEITRYGIGDREYLAGLRQATISGAGHFASTFEDRLATMLGATTNPTFEYSPESTAAGRVLYTGSFILTDYSISSPVDDKVSFSIDMQVTGAVTSTNH